MNNENSNHTPGLDDIAKHNHHLFVDSAEELDFRLKAFFRAYTSNEPDGVQLLRRAIALLDCLSDFKELVETYRRTLNVFSNE